MDIWPVFTELLVILCLLLALALFIGFIYLLRDNPRTMPITSSKAAIIKTVYFYVVSLIGLMMVVFSVADLCNLGLKTWVFTKADQNPYPQPPCAVAIPAPAKTADTDAAQTAEAYQANLKQCEASRISDDEARAIQNQQSAVRDISFLVVGIPLFLYHWITIRKDKGADRGA